MSSTGSRSRTNRNVSHSRDSSSNSSSDDSSEDDADDTSFGTMARFVPTLVLERLRIVGESAMATKKTAGPALGSAAAVSSLGHQISVANVPQVGLDLLYVFWCPHKRDTPR